MTVSPWLVWGLLVIAMILSAGVVLMAVMLGELLRQLKKRENKMSDAELETGPIEVVMEQMETKEGRTFERPAPIQITSAPMIGEMTLYQWLIWNEKDENIWQKVVSEMYTRAAGVPEIASYFATTIHEGRWDSLQHHFLGMLRIVTSTGVTDRMLNTLEHHHTSVRDQDGRMIDAGVYDLVISTLVGILLEVDVPQEGIAALGRTIEPIKQAIVQ